MSSTLKSANIPSLTLTRASTPRRWYRLYCCIKSACRADGIEFSPTFEEFCDRVTPDDITAWFMASNVVDEKKTAARAKAKAKA